MKRKHIVRSVAGIILASVLLVCAGMESMASVTNTATAKGDEEEEKYIYLSDVGTFTVEEGTVYADFFADLDLGTKFTVQELPGASKQAVAVAEKEWHGEGEEQGAVKCELYYPGDEEMLFLGSIGNASSSEPVRYDSNGIYCKSRDKIECYRINKKGDGLEVAESAQSKDAAAYRKLSQKYDSAEMLWFYDVGFQHIEEVGKTINSLDKKYQAQIQSGKVPSYCGGSGWDDFLEEKRDKAEGDSIFGTIGETGGYTIYGIFDDEGQAMLVEHPDGSYVWIEAPFVSVHDEQPRFSIIEGEEGEEYLAIMTYVLHGTGYSEDTLIIVDGDYAYHLLAGEYLPAMCENFTVTGQGDKWSLEIDGKTAGEYDTKGDDTSACTLGFLTEIEIKDSQIHVISEMIVFNESNMIGDFPGVALDLILDYSGEGDFEVVGCKYHKGLV